MTVIEQVRREDALPAPPRGYARDTITLGWGERLHVRGQRRSDGGVAFGLSLPRGSMLRGGDCLVLDQAKTVVLVVERAEPVFLIEPLTPEEWDMFAYHTGNQHQTQQHIPFACATLAFRPATSVSGHDR